MPLNPAVGRPGGQRYDVARAIRTFLEQMAGGGGFSFGGAVIKELIQNADDAGASELVVALDERNGEELPRECRGEYGPLLEPALLIRNDARFRVVGEVLAEDQDDFTAICEVAGGHKRFNPTAAGRFGIGFNSVYFLTDTPVLFSRREVHVFDLRRLMFPDDGWRFSLDDFPAVASGAGPIKTVLEWVLPKAILREGSFQELAAEGRDYRHTIFRLPLRQTLLSTGTGEQRGPVFPSASFPNEVNRHELLREMCEEARRSLIFLKSLRRVTFGGIVEKRFEEWACVEATRRPSTELELEQFVNNVRGMRDGSGHARREECSFICDVSLRVNGERLRVSPGSAAFQVTHVADFTKPELGALAEKLRKNEERAVPWVAIAAPLDARSFDWEGAGNARWRVFLPLVEEGPSACILNAAVFVDPSRRAVEFRTDGSDETLRKSRWNRALVEQLLAPLLRDVSTVVIDIAPQLIEQEPKKYLSLFPAASSAGEAAACLADVVRASFCNDLWLLKLHDIWKEPFDVWVGPDGSELALEKVPEWLGRYRAAFQSLTTESRRFIAWAVGDAVGERLGEDGNVEVKKTGKDVADCVLVANQRPQPSDVLRLLKLLSEESLNTADLKGRWALQREGGDESLLRFDPDCLYLVRTKQTPAVYETLGAVGISFENAEWVAPGVGLCALPAGQIQDLATVVDADDSGAVELLRRTGPENCHDLLSAHFELLPIVDFLCSQSPHRLTEDLRLAFLVKTAVGGLDRQHLGVLFLRPESPTPEEDDVWQGLLRQTFAEVDPQFAPHLRRLLAHAPQLLTCLGEDGCNVRLTGGDLLDLFHDVRMRDAGFVRRLAQRLNQRAGDRGAHVYRAARLLLREAERRWDSMEQPLRDSVLALPIHRAADGSIVSLLSEEETPSNQIRDRFFLQSEDDLRDAPFEPQAGQLLHSLDPDLRSFYRHRLRIRERGRIEVLKECLRQIGTHADRSGGILKYVERYYLDTVEQLRERGREGTADLRELKELHGAARGIPCVDGYWRSAAECVDASPIRPLLERQGWQGPRLHDLLFWLGYPRPVAEASSDQARRARTLWEVQEMDRDFLAESAIISESPDFSFIDRVRVIADNLKLVPEMPPARAAVTNAEILESLCGPVELGNLVLVDPDEIRLDKDAVRAIVPEAADLRPLAAKFTHGRVPILATVLRALSVPTVDAAKLRSRTVDNFATIWARLDSKGRLALLEWLGGNDAELPEDAPNLDTVFVGGATGSWVCPSTVIAPSWASPAPPNVPATSIARTVGIPRQVLRLWNQWCGFRDLDAVVGCVVHKTCELPREQWQVGARRLADWLEKIAGEKGPDAVAAALRHLPWVLARKGGEFAFKPPKEVLDHLGAEVLQHEFWVVVERVPTSLARSVQTLQLERRRAALEAIARCLASSASAELAATRTVYELLVELTSDEQTREVWREVARSMSVYRLFRTPDRGPHPMVSSQELFLGDQELKRDFGHVLYCLGTEDSRKKNIRQLYRKLGVNIRPSVSQLVGALSRIPRESRNPEVHGALVDTLTGSPRDDLQKLRELDLSGMKVRSCAKTYEPLSGCYRDLELDRPSRLSPESRERIVYGRDSANKKLMRLLDEDCSNVVLDLRSVAAAELTHEPEESHGIEANVLDAWRDWIEELGTQGSVVQTDVQKLAFTLPSGQVRLCIVPKVHVRFRLRDGSDVAPSAEWDGPELFHDSRDRLFVRRDLVDRDFVGRAGDVKRLDARIAEQLEELLRKQASPGSSSSDFGTLLAVVRETLNRPGAVLQRMKEEKQEHFFHQYLDQTADPEFSSLFDKYRRTSTSATAKRRSMEEEMRNMISLRFVDARRNQIRGYGYDEFAIFAELVQNAEDAYSQRDQLELPEPPGRGVTFTYSVADGGKNLSVSHYGRPFNLWRHGAKRIDAFRYDVEGVLKSAGSFKPHSRTDGVRPVGRFGLGFKSVYLVTDTPRIHSGDWHFEITAGCIPNEITAPVDCEKGQTRIVLPLITGAPEELHSVRGRYANLLPFLRNVGDLRVEHSDGTSLGFKTTSRRMLCTTDGHQVDHVEISGVNHASGGVIRLLRGRHDGHEGQLGVLLGSDRLPVAWSNVFDSDVFAVLPLRVRLSCGVGVSNLFEVQSGRTHLIDPTTNLERIAEVAGSLRTLTKALIADDNVSTREVMSRFWGLWRWDGGDEEACDLRLALARELVQLTRSMSVIPTRHPKQFVKLGPDVLFSFENLPEELADKLLEKAIELAVDGRRVRVQESNVLPTPIRSAVERVYAAAGETGGVAVTRIGWSELGEEFQVQPWLADHPDLVSAMARNLPLDGLEQVQPWLCKCVFRSASGKHEHLTDLLPSRFPGRDHLPRRLLNLLDDAYDEAALGLLKQVGLPSRPALETMKSWLRSGLDRNECDNVLQYLSEAGRWRREYYDLGSLLNEPWFDANGVRVTAADAFAGGLLSLENFDPDPAFHAWLGIDTGTFQINLENVRWDRPVPDPQRALEEIWIWWSKEGERFVHRFNERTYPQGKPLPLDQYFSGQDTLQRQNWLSLMMLAALQTMGRTNPDQHRNFLRQCAQRGWMDVFADPGLPADRWIGVLEDYLGTQTYDIRFYHWMRQFVSIYQIARWLPEYAGSFLAIDKYKKRFDLDQVTRPAMNPDFSGGGLSAPPLTRTLGIGACFVVRELVRTDVLQSEFTFDHAYVAVGRVRDVLARLGMTSLQGESASYRHSRQIHNFLLDHLGPDKAHFNRCFDLPFLAIAEDSGLQTDFLGCQLPPDDEEGA